MKCYEKKEKKEKGIRKTTQGQPPKRRSEKKKKKAVGDHMRIMCKSTKKKKAIPSPLSHHPRPPSLISTPAPNPHLPQRPLRTKRLARRAREPPRRNLELFLPISIPSISISISIGIGSRVPRNRPLNSHSPFCCATGLAAF